MREEIYKCNRCRKVIPEADPLMTLEIGYEDGVEGHSVPSEFDLCSGCVKALSEFLSGDEKKEKKEKKSKD